MALKAATALVSTTASAATKAVSSPNGERAGLSAGRLVNVPVLDVGAMRVVPVEVLRGLRVVAPTVGVKMTAPPVMTIVLVVDDRAGASIAFASSVIVTATALGSSTARLQRVVASTASTVVVTRLLLAVLLIRIISLVLVLVLVLM